MGLRHSWYETDSYDPDNPYDELESVRDDVRKQTKRILKAIFETGNLEEVEIGLDNLCDIAEIDMNKTGIFNSVLFKEREAI